MSDDLSALHQQFQKILDLLDDNIRISKLQAENNSLQMDFLESFKELRELDKAKFKRTHRISLIALLSVVFLIAAYLFPRLPTDYQGWIIAAILGFGVPKLFQIFVDDWKS